MNYKVEWSKRALNDLDYIHEQHANYSTSKADKLLEILLEKSDQLYDHPRLGQRESSQDGRPEEIRYLVYQIYKVIYAVFEDCVTIITVFDTRQDPSKLRI